MPASGFAEALATLEAATENGHFMRRPDGPSIGFSRLNGSDELDDAAL